MGFPRQQYWSGLQFLQRIYLNQAHRQAGSLPPYDLGTPGDYRLSKSVMTLLGAQHRGWKLVPALETLVITPAQRAAPSILLGAFLGG